MTATIEYQLFNSEDQLARMKELMEPLRPLFPHWTKKIHIHLYDQIAPGDNSSDLMVNLGHTEYLHFTINVYYCFFDNPRDIMRRKLIHELVHALHAEVLMFDNDNLIDYVKAHNPDLGAYVSREHRQRVERFTQYMAFAIDQAMPNTDRSVHSGALFEAREGTVETIMLKAAEPFPGRSQDSGDAIAFSGVSAIAKKRAEIWPESLTTSGSDREI